MYISVLPAEILSLVPEYSVEIPWVQSDAYWWDKHKQDFNEHLHMHLDETLLKKKKVLVLV